MSTLHERASVGVQVESRRRASERRKIELFKQAGERGILEQLTQNEQYILQIRGFFDLEQGRPLVPFRSLQEQGLLLSTYQAAFYSEVGAFRRISSLLAGEKVGSVGKERLKMTSDEERFLLENPDLPLSRAARQLRHGESTVLRWREELNIPKRPRGRPRK